MTNNLKIETVYIADMQKLFVDCLIANFGTNQPLEIMGVSNSGATAYLVVKKFIPDLLITELNLNDLGGINLIRKIKASGIPTKVILLSSDVSPALIHKALSAGVDGIILKNDGYSLLIEAIAVIHKRKFLSPGISDPLVNNFLGFSNDPLIRKTSPLSDREEQVAILIGEGVSSREIAKVLSISEKTVSKHRGNIFKKLNINNTAKLVRYVYDNNLVG